MAFRGDSFATECRAGPTVHGVVLRVLVWGLLRSKKVDPPGGTTGRVGCGTGWMRRPCRTQDPREKRFQSKCKVEGRFASFRKRYSNQTQSIDLSNCRNARGPCSCRKRRTGERRRSGDSRRSSNRRCWRRSRCRQSQHRRGRLQRPSPSRAAWPVLVVVEAIVPVTARAARATAAILVLIDMRNSIRL